MTCRLLSSALALSRLTQVGFGAMAKKKRYFSSTPAVWSHIQQRAIPGNNLPFDINNRFKLTLWSIIYSVSGFNAPLLLMILQLGKH